MVFRRSLGTKRSKFAFIHRNLNNRYWIQPLSDELKQGFKLKLLFKT